MSVSILRARVVLDRPYYAYTGTAEPVTGNILIKHTPQIKHMAADAELFGPLIINATFSGQISTMLCRNDKIPYSSKTPLFCITSVIYDGPFKASPDEDNKFPFSFNFPEKAEPRKHPLFRGNVEPDSMATGVNGALPPSFRINYLGFEDQIDGSVEYRVRCEVEMPGIAIEVAGLEFAPEVRYERSRIPIASAKRDTTTRNQPVRIRTSKLFSPDDQPHGFRQKSKALFRSSDKLPCWAFDVSCTSPTDVYKGEGLAFDVRLNIIEAECTVPVAPVITLEKFSVRALTSSTVSAEGQTLTSSDSPDSNSDGTHLQLATSEALSVPFSQATDWTKPLITQPVTGLPSEFRTAEIERYYMLQYGLTLKCAGEEVTIRKTNRIVLHPPLDTGK